ncbi:MAG: SurA N-terminal domain-containing protein, partial [Desulfobacteraceae bacterium]
MRSDSMQKTKNLLMTVMVLCAVLLWGCGRKSAGDNVLLQVGSQSVRLSEFQRDVEAAAEEAFPGEREPNPDSLNDLRIRVLNQLTEELIICEYAGGLGLEVTDAELDKAVQAIKSDYPDKTFEETLLENAVSFQIWQQKLASYAAGRAASRMHPRSTGKPIPEATSAGHSRRGRTGHSKSRSRRHG